MSMFKPLIDNSLINATHMGVGSIISTSLTDRYLVVGDGTANTVFLVSLNTFRRFEKSIYVLDINWFTEKEVREIVNLTGLNYALSDYTLNTRGLKEVWFD